MKRISNLMLLSNFLSTIFYALSYPYIYAETMKVVPTAYISLEQILACLGTIVFCKLWNTYSNKLFRHYRKFLLLEVLADTVLFADVLIRKDLSFYFLFNIIIFSIITRNICCGRTKMRAIVHPDEVTREQYDNNCNIVNSVATLLGSGIAMICPLGITLLFVFAVLGNVIDNIFDIYVYNVIDKKGMVK